MPSKLVSLVALLSLPGAGSASLDVRQSSGASPSLDFFSPNAPTNPVALTGDSDFDFLLYLGLDLAVGGGADVADILNAASYITPMDMEPFASTFWSLTNQTLAIADSIGHDASARITARDSYFAASTYYRFADFYLHGDPSDPRLPQLWAAQTSAFSHGLARLTSVSAERFTLHTKYNFTIPGIYYRIDNRRRPTLIITTGYDGPQEEFLHWLGPSIIDHGWNFVTYEGPGQPTVIHEQGIGFRPDWEVVITNSRYEQIDAHRMSMGGYLAARAAAFKPRIKAQILNGGIDDLFDAFSGHFGSILGLLAQNNTLFDLLTYEYVVNNTNASTASRWGVQEGLYTFNTRSPSDWLDQSRAYNASTFVNQTKIPTWVVNATQDIFFPNQSVELVDALLQNGDQATLYTMGGVAGFHDQVGAILELNRAMWPWIDKIWPNTPPLGL